MKAAPMASNKIPSTRPARDRIDFAQLTGYLGYQLRQAQTASFRDLAQPFAALNLTPGEFSLLTLVEANPDIRQTDLVRVYGLDKSTLSVAVNRLIQRGLVASRQLPEDRRYHGLSLAGAGRDLLATATALVEDQEDRMAAALSPEEWETVMGALGRIVAALKRD